MTRAPLGVLAAVLLLGGLAAAPAASRQRAAGPLAGRVVVLDPGHNPGNAAHAAQIGRPVFAGVPENGGRKPCDTAGTTTASGYSEAAYTWDVTRRVGSILTRAGTRVVYTRTATHPAWGP